MHIYCCQLGGEAYIGNKTLEIEVAFGGCEVDEFSSEGDESFRDWYG